MTSRRVCNALLLVALAAMIAVLTWLRPAGPTVRNVEYAPDMMRSGRYNTFSPNANFADGKTLQAAVPGTMPIDAAVWYRSAEAAREAQATTNPHSPSDPDALARGAAMYETFCQPCHDAKGGGNGPIVQHGYPAPPPLTTGNALSIDDSEMYRIISQGSNEMPSYAAQIAPADRWKAVLYVRSLQPRDATR